MVKAEVANKRKSIVNETPSKKGKFEVKPENGKAFTPKKQNQSPKKNQQAIPVTKSEPESPKNVKPFAGTKQLDKGQKPKFNKGKGDGNKKGGNQDNKKRKRSVQFSSLIADVKSKEGTKDAETLAKLNEKIQAMKSKGELTKTAKRKLSLLTKLVVICEEGAAAAAAQSRARVDAQKAADAKTGKKPTVAKAESPKKKLVAAAAPVKDEEEDDEDSDEEEEDSDVEADDDDEEDDDEEDDDDDDEEAAPPAPKKKPAVKQVKTDLSASKTGTPEDKPQEPKKKLNLTDLKNTDIVKKGQKRFVLFIGNIPFDITKQDIAGHFSKVGDIVDIRIPSDKGSNKPRGFAYIEVSDETAYEKCMSMHHSQINGRRINVLYTQGGKKKGNEKKNEIKAKNFKLHALRRQGKLAGSVKESQKRSFRRNKAKNGPATNSGEN